jgi:O-antigen ligase
MSVTGPQVIEEFSSVFADAENRDSSADSRIELWTGCVKAMSAKPVFGLGPLQWRPNANRFTSYSAGKSAHSAWFELGAEIGPIGMVFLVLFFLTCLVQVYTILKVRNAPSLANSGRMAITSIVGFMVAISFISGWGIELGYYLVLLGAAAVKLYDARAEVAEPRPAPRPAYAGVPAGLYY